MELDNLSYKLGYKNPHKAVLVIGLRTNPIISRPTDTLPGKTK